jgi:hypothetical protein
MENSFLDAPTIHDYLCFFSGLGTRYSRYSQLATGLLAPTATRKAVRRETNIDMQQHALYSFEEATCVVSRETITANVFIDH